MVLWKLGGVCVCGVGVPSRAGVVGDHCKPDLKMDFKNNYNYILRSVIGHRN